MLALGHALPGELFSAPFFLSKLASRCLVTFSSPAASCKEAVRSSGSNRPLSVKSLAHWAFRVTPPDQLHDLSRNISSYRDQPVPDHSKDSLLSKNSSSVPVVLAVLVFSSFSTQNVGRISLFLVYTMDKGGTLTLTGSAYTPITRANLNSLPSIRFDFLETTFSNWPGVLSVNLFFLPSFNLEEFERRHRPFAPFLCYGTDSRRPKTLFWFFRFNGHRRLGASRRVLLDQGGYQITHIGKGAFAVISRVVHKPSGDVRVMKRITFDKNGLGEYLARNEVETLGAMLGNPWFPPLLNHFKDETEFLVTMPFYRRGDLSGLLQHKGYLGRELAQFYAAQLIIAIHSLHKKGIIHRDIKTDNIFLDDQGHLILADLGLAENIASYEGGEEMMKYFPEWIEARERGGDDFPLLWVNNTNPLGTTGVAGTFWYTAPEVFRKEHYSFGVDYWSVGVVYHELITGHIPFNHYKPYPANQRPALDFRIKPGQLKDVEPWEIQGLRELLQPRPADRPKTLTDIKNNAIFQGVDWIKMARREVAPPLLPPPLQED